MSMNLSTQSTIVEGMNNSLIYEINIAMTESVRAALDNVTLWLNLKELDNVDLNQTIDSQTCEIFKTKRICNLNGSIDISLEDGPICWHDTYQFCVEVSMVTEKDIPLNSSLQACTEISCERNFF